MNKFDQKHISNTVAYAKKLDKSFDKVINQISALANDPSAKFSKSFVFKENKQLAKSANLIFNNLYKDIEGIITAGNETEWALSNNKNDALVKSFTNNLKILKAKPDWTYHNLDALNAFTNRGENGIDLSKRIWKIKDQAQAEMEIHLGLGILNGDSADIISRRIRQYLNEPDALFRRIRNDVGELEWSKAAKALEPGQGKYRSAYKNARRLTITETNMSYRTADQMRWDKLGFVLGYQVVLSGSHPALDICDDLKGEYPKSFIFTGWHPQCLCHAIPILMTADQYDKYEDAILDGTEEDFLKNVKGVNSVPKGFTRWVSDNTERSQGWKSQPYFIKDNFANGNLNSGLNTLPDGDRSSNPKIGIGKPVRTEAQIKDILNRWYDRRYNMLKVETPDQIKDYINSLPEAKDWFKNGFNGLKYDPNPNNNGSTFRHKGIIAIRKNRMEDCATAITKTRLGKVAEITEKEADAMGTFWHEITHNGNNTTTFPTKLETKYMELANEFVARKTLPEFYKAMGSNIVPFEKFMSNRPSTGYNPMVMNYDELIQLIKLDTKDVVNKVRDHLFNQGYDTQLDGLVNAVKDAVIGKPKLNGKKVTITDIKNMVKGCEKYRNTTDYVSWLRKTF